MAGGFRFIWTISLFAAVLDAQQPIQPPPKLKSCSVEGQLVNAATGEPVRKAEISLWGMGTSRDQRYVTTSTAAGRFAVPDMEPGKYSMSASKRGYSGAEYGARSAGRSGITLSLDPGQHLSGLIWRISPQAVITGRVLDVDGEPLPNIEVSLLQYRFERGKRRLAFSGQASTNDLGEYRLFGLSPGRYYLSAAANRMVRGEYDSGQGYAPTYYPGTSDPAGAKAIELQAGTLLRGADITLTRARTARVRGRVVVPDSKQHVQGGWVSVQRRGDESQFIFGGNFGSSFDEQGNFEIRGVVPGTYYVEAFRDGKTLRAQQSIEVHESDVENIVLELQPGAELKGQLRVEGPAAGSLANTQIMLQPDDSSYSGGVGANVKADGSFTLADVQSARYSLSFCCGSVDSGNYYLKSARLGDEEVLESGLDLTHGVSGTLEVVLSSNGGQVEGVVLNANEQPEAAATVVLVPDEPRRSQTRLYKDATTDQYGRFTITAIAPGGYKLFAWEDVEDGAYEDPDYLKAFEALGEPRTIRERSRESAQLKLIPAEGKKKPPR